MAEKSDWLEKAKEEVANNQHNKSEKFWKKDEEFFKTPVYGIFEDVSATTLHVTMTEEHHKLVLESLKKQFPKFHFETYCIPLGDEFDYDKINKRYSELFEDEDDD